MIDLSITIVAYQDYDDVIAAVQSIEKNTSPSIRKQIYIVDNSCLEEGQPQESNTDRSKLLEHLSRYSDVEYLDTHENLGFGKGHNYVLNRLDSKYHAIVNPDILLKEDSFAKLLAFFENYEAVGNPTGEGKKPLGMAVPRLEMEDGQMIKAYRLEPTRTDMFIRYFCPGLFKKRKARHTMDEMDYSKPFAVPFAQGSFLVIRTELFKQLGGFDERYFMYMEDADLCKQVNAENCVMYCPETSVIHKWEKGSHKSGKLFRIHVKSMMEYFKKWK